MNAGNEQLGTVAATASGACVAPDGGHRGAGQALVEFALVVTLLAFLLVGAVDLGRAFYFDIAASSAAMAGAEAAATGSPDDTTRTMATNSVGSFATPGITIVPAQSSRVGTTCTPSTCIWVSVTAVYNFQPITPLLGNIIGNSVTVSRSVTQRMRTDCQTSSGGAC